MAYSEPSTRTKHPAVAEIIDAIGASDLAALLGLTEFSIIAAKRDGLFPAKWFGPLSGLCEREGLNCPMDAFRWLDADKKLTASQSAHTDCTRAAK